MTEQEREKAIAKRKKYEARLRSAIRDLSKNKQFTDVIWDILSFCEVFNAGYAKADFVQYRDGKRSVGVYIVDLLDSADPQLFPKILLNRRSINE